MELKYNILWIEDEKRSIKRTSKIIRQFLEDEYGFECSEDDVLVLDYDEFENIYIENSNMKTSTDIDKYDLILVDYDLGEAEHTGDKLIKIVRDGNIYSEILFYSSDLDSLKLKLNEHFIDGVFTSSRDELEDKVKQLIKVTIKKVQDVNNLRGLIMAEVAELDRIKKRIIKKFEPKVDDDFKKYIKDDVLGQLNSFFDEFEWVKSNDDSYKQIELSALVENFIFDSSKKARTVYKIKRQEDACSSIDYTFDNYMKDIIKKRNVLAHQKEEQREDGIKILKYPKKGALEFTEEHCKQIRKDIKKYKKLLEDIEKKI
jgi:hypothetical protein